MKLLVSDYDKTLKVKGKNFKLNIDAIKDFKKRNNTFAIATGRTFRSIKMELNEHDIPYDYLLCNNGSILFNRNNEIIFADLLNDDNIEKILHILRNVPTVCPYGIYDRTDECDDIIEIGASFEKLIDLIAYKKVLETALPNVRCFTFGHSIYLKNNFTKSDGISVLANEIKIDRSDIYTIGDHCNDIEMLQDYNGHKPFLSSPLLRLRGIPSCQSVHSLINKIK